MLTSLLTKSTLAIGLIGAALFVGAPAASAEPILEWFPAPGSTAVVTGSTIKLAATPTRGCEVVGAVLTTDVTFVDEAANLLGSWPSGTTLSATFTVPAGTYATVIVSDVVAVVTEQCVGPDPVKFAARVKTAEWTHSAEAVVPVVDGRVMAGLGILALGAAAVARTARRRKALVGA